MANGFPTPPPVQRPPADELAFTLNGKKFTEGDVEKAFRSYTAGVKMDENRLLLVLQQQHQRVVDTMIDEELMNNEAGRLNIKVADAEIEPGTEKLLARTLREQGRTRQEFEEQIQKGAGMSLADYLKSRRAGIEKQLVAERIGDALFKDVEITDQEMHSKYERSPAYAARIKVSHILLKVDRNDPPDKKEAARKKAEEVLAQAKKPGADFAALAREYSDCPSKAKGGELPEFLSNGRILGPGGSMDLTFTKAAFALKPGEISDVVETQFGFHIIKANSKEPAKAFEQVQDEIRSDLKVEHEMMKLRDHMKELKEKAKIEYPPGKAPATRPAFPPTARPTTYPSMHRPTTRPSAPNMMPRLNRPTSTAPAGMGPRPMRPRPPTPGGMTPAHPPTPPAPAPK
jgi:peptidyl-prolyl cis-trans isomerase C